MAVQDPRPDDLVDHRYRLIEPLARGGSATVWRATDERLGRTVAVKILTAAGRQTREEAKALARLSHPHIAGVFDYGLFRGQAYLVLELVDGPSLAEVLGGVPAPAAIAAAAQIAAALAAAHARGLVHRDVTPSNIMLTPGGAKLIDFGISAIHGESEVDSDGALRGTPAFAAPERLPGGTVDPPSDMYSFGVVLGMLLTGDPPETVARLRERCLATDPSDRPSAREAQRVLEAEAPPEALARYTASTVDEATVTRIIPAQAERPRHHHEGRLAIIVGVGAAIWLAIWGMSGWGTGDLVDTPQALAAPALPLPSACTATYQLRSDDGRSFLTRLTVAATAEPLPQGWQLTLHLPPGHRSQVTVPGWLADSDALSSPPQNDLPIGTPTYLSLSGHHTGANPLPTAATVGGKRCDLVVLGPSGTPKAATTKASKPTGAPHAKGTAKTKPDPPRSKGTTNGTKNAGPR